MSFILLIFEEYFHTWTYQASVGVRGCPSTGIRLLSMAVTGNMLISSLFRQILRLFIVMNYGICNKYGNKLEIVQQYFVVFLYLNKCI